MQASYDLRRSPLTLSVLGSILLIALILGGFTGYVIRGAVSQPPVIVATESSVPETTGPGPVWTSTAPEGQAQYVQGGRPVSVYGGIPPTVYVQGGRPAIVYATP
jgi:hypothetical protein